MLRQTHSFLGVRGAFAEQPAPDQKMNRRAGITNDVTQPLDVTFGANMELFSWFRVFASEIAETIFSFDGEVP